MGPKPNEPPIQSAAWKQVVHRHQADPSLTDDEKAFLATSSLTDYVEDVGTFKVTERKKSRIQVCLRILRPLLTNLERFTGAFDSFAQADPHGVLALVWGSIRIVFVVARDVEGLYDDLATFFGEISHALGRLTAYEKLFEQSSRFNNRLRDTFEDILDFCSWLRKTVHDGRIKRLAKSILTDSYRRQARDKIAVIEDKCRETEKEARLALAEATIDYQHDALTFFEESREFYQRVGYRDIAQEVESSLRTAHEKLAPLSIDDYLDRTQRRRASGTCSWIAECEEFVPLVTKAAQYKPRTLWISGKPGCGKKFLAGYIAEKLEFCGPTGIFFCDMRNSNRKTLLNILRTWCWQLLQSARSLAVEVASQLSDAISLTVKTLRSILKQLCCHKPSYLLLDGLDECDGEDRLEILEALEEITGLTNLIILSRPESDIEKAFQRWKRRGAALHLEVTPRHTKNDIDHFITNALHQLDNLDGKLLNTIAHKLGTNANGMFLYVQLMINELDQQDTNEERRSILDQLPSGINALYRRAIDKIKATKRQRRDRIINMLQLVLCASQPLTVAELSTALGIRIGAGRFNADDIPDAQRLINEFCQSMLEIDPIDKKVKILHASVKSFLCEATEEPPVINIKETQLHMVAICLTFLNYEDRKFASRPKGGGKIPATESFPFATTLHAPLHAHLSKQPFLKYAVTAWVTHLNSAFAAKEHGFELYLEPLCTFISSEERMLKWMELFHFLCKEDESNALLSRDIIQAWIIEHESSKLQNPLSAVAGTKDEFDAEPVAFAMNGFRLDHEEASFAGRQKDFAHPDTNFLMSMGTRWEKWMAYLGFSDRHGIVRWQRWTKTEVMTRDPAHIAAFFNFADFIKQSLKTGLAVDDIGIMDRSLLGLATWGEALDTVKLLIDSGADIDRCPCFSECDGAFPLVEAVSHDEFAPVVQRHFSAAKFLLEAGAKVESNLRSLNPLHVMFQWWSGTKAQLDLLEMILERSQDPDKLLETPNPFNGMNCLHIAAMFNLDAATIGILVNAHSAPNDYLEKVWGTSSKTALLEACYHKHSLAGPALLARGANVRHNMTNRSTALSIAAASCSNMLVELISTGADCATVDSTGQTAMHRAAWADWAQGINELNSAGAPIDVKDCQSRTPLDLALNMERQSAVAALRALGAQESVEHQAETRRQALWIRKTYEIFFVLKSAFYTSRPKQHNSIDVIVRRILNEADFLKQTISIIQRPMSIMQGDAGRPYLISRPIRGAGITPIRKVEIQVLCESREGPHPPDQGEAKSWTWIELGSRPANGASAGEKAKSPVSSGHRLLTNRLGVKGMQTHNITILADTSSLDPISTWLGRLINGQSIVLVPMARLPQWEIVMHQARISIFTYILGDK